MNFQELEKLVDRSNVQPKLKQWFYSSRNMEALQVRIQESMRQLRMNPADLASVPRERYLAIMDKVFTNFNVNTVVQHPKLTEMYFQQMNEQLFQEAYNDIVLTLQQQRMHLQGLQMPRPVLPLAVNSRQRRSEGVPSVVMAPLPSGSDFRNSFTPMF